MSSSTSRSTPDNKAIWTTLRATAAGLRHSRGPLLAANGGGAQMRPVMPQLRQGPINTWFQPGGKDSENAPKLFQQFLPAPCLGVPAGVPLAPHPGSGEDGPLKKYWHVLNIGIQNNLTYRFNFLARSVFGLIPLMAILYVWRTIYAGKPPNAMIGSYSLAEMISYYLLTTLVDALTAVNEDDWQIAADIKDGNISQFLLKPIDYLTYRVFLFFSGRITYLAVAAIPLTIFMLALRQYFVLPHSWPDFGLFLLATLLTALLQFFMSYTMAMLAFWVLEVSTFIFIVFAFEYIASGHLFPLDILPHGLQQVLQYTPFPYQLYFPVSLYLGKVSGPDLVRGFCIQAGWVLATYGLARFMWNRGIRKYSAVGG